MPGKITVLKGESLTLTTAVNVLAALRTAAANALAARVKIKRLEISQSGTTTLGMIRGQIATRDTAGTLTCTSLAPTTINPVGGPASGLTGSTAPAGTDARSGINGTVDSGGAYTEIYPFNFANTAGYLYKPAPDEEIWIQASTVLAIRFKADPATLTGWTFTLTLEEEG
jgi:hypothetical protein